MDEGAGVVSFYTTSRITSESTGCRPPRDMGIQREAIAELVEIPMTTYSAALTASQDAFVVALTQSSQYTFPRKIKYRGTNHHHWASGSNPSTASFLPLAFRRQSHPACRRKFSDCARSKIQDNREVGLSHHKTGVCR